MVTLNVLFFSTLRQLVGRDELKVTLDGAGPFRVRDMLERLYAEFPELRKWDGQVLLALDHAYVDREAEIHNGQEFAIMPPVQGG